MKGSQSTRFICALVLVATLGLSSAEELEDQFDQYEPLPVPLPQTQLQQVAQRTKRDLKGDLLDTAESLGIGGGYVKKFRSLLQGVPPKMQDAFLKQDFSNVTDNDMRNLNVSVIEYIPPNLLSKMNVTLLSPIVEKLLQANKPIALGRVMTAMGDKMDSNMILDKLKQGGGISDSTEEAASVMLYTALNKLGDKGELNQQMIRRLSDDGLLGFVPEEQLMKVTNLNTARLLLDRMYKNAQSDTSDLTDIDDQALMYKLAETGYGKAETWTSDSLRHVGPKIIGQMPAEFLKNLKPDLVSDSINTLRQTRFESPLQAKSIADSFLKKFGINNQEGTDSQGHLSHILNNLGNLGAFVNPSITKDTSVLNAIVMASDQLNLPAPLKAVSGLLQEKFKGGKKVKDLAYEDIRGMSGALIKNSPPNLVNKAMETRALSEYQLREIAGVGGSSLGPQGSGIFNNPFFQGIISQVSSYAVQFFTRGGKINFRELPGAFFGALGIKGIRDMSTRDVTDDVIDKLVENPDALDDAQKAMLLKRLKDEGVLDTTDLPPEIRALQPRKKTDGSGGKWRMDSVLKGLPSDAELRLAYRHGKNITASELEMDRYLVGTLTPKQVMDMDIEEIPAVLAVVRKSKDGPQQQTLEALSKRFAEYIRLKSEDYDSPDKKLLKYITAAEVSKLPATVLAYFIDHRQTSKLPPDMRKEIMIAMGELSTKDHATIPGKTREEIILQGLAAIDSLTGAKKIDVPELAAIGNGVADLPPDRIEKMTPVAVEQALEVIKGTADDDDDGLKQRACLSKDQKAAWRNKVLELYGEPNKWDPATVTSLCCAIGLLNSEDLLAIAPDALATCRCPSDARPPSHLSELKKALDANCKHEQGEFDNTKKNLEKVKSEIAFDLDDLESQILTGRKKRSSSGEEKLTCFKVRITGTAAPFSKEQLESLDEKEMGECLYELGVDSLPLEYSRVLWNKLLSSKQGKVEALTADDLRFAGHVLSGIKLSDVNALDMKDWDIVFPFGKNLGLSKNVLEKMATHLEDKQRRIVGQFGTNDLVVTRNILCGFSPEKLAEIQSNSFRDALPVLKSLDEGCEQTRLAALAGITMRPEIFGDASKWTSADIRGVGILLVGLSSRVIQSIPADSFIGVTPSVASALPPNILQALSADQVSQIPMFSAQSMSEEQKSAVSAEAREKLDAVIRGPLVSHAVISHQMFSVWTLLTLFTAALFAHRIL